ncbi:hypothetical protein JHD48_06825, partial [Sulfurimonas sp. SAG-AH-194-I05]
MNKKLLALLTTLTLASSSYAISWAEIKNDTKDTIKTLKEDSKVSFKDIENKSEEVWEDIKNNFKDEEEKKPR